MVIPVDKLDTEFEGQIVKLVKVESLQSGLEGHQYTIISKKNDSKLGDLVIEFENGTPIISSICVADPDRGYGIGTDAILLLLPELAQLYENVKAFAPPELGLAAFFWVRMGFRPCFGKAPEGGLWFERNLTESLTYNPMKS